MEAVYQDIPRLYTALAEWAGCLIYVILLKNRFPKVKTVILCTFTLGVQIIFLTITDKMPTIFWFPCMIVAAGLMFGLIESACKLKMKDAGYCCVKAFLLAEFAASLEWQLHTFLASKGMTDFRLQIMLLVVIYAMVFMTAVVLERPILSKEYLAALSVRELILAVVIAVIVFIFSNLSFVITNSPFTSWIKADIFNIRTLVDLGGIAVIYAFQSRICEYIAERELVSIQGMLKSQYEQYRNYQESMEMMHIMYHDLKHQVDALRVETDAVRRTEWLDAMDRQLEEKYMACKTGNQVLDTVLGAKIFYAKKNQIQITYVADGALLDFMHVTDICTIFGNALDNAIEYAIMLPDAEKRLIHVVVSSRKKFVFIQVSNYCEENIKILAGQLPITTKTDKKNHGYGLKSIQYSVEKYRGSMSVDIKKKWFELSIVIPYR